MSYLIGLNPALSTSASFVFGVHDCSSSQCKILLQRIAQVTCFNRLKKTTLWCSNMTGLARLMQRSQSLYMRRYASRGQAFHKSSSIPRALLLITHAFQPYQLKGLRKCIAHLMTLLSIMQLDQQQKDITQLENLMAKQSTDLVKHESSRAAWEAEKASQAAFYEAELEKIQQQLHNVKTGECKSHQMYEHRFEAMKASLEAQSSCSREAALTTELNYSKAMTNLQTSFQTQVVHFNLQIEVNLNLALASFPSHMPCMHSFYLLRMEVPTM